MDDVAARNMVTVLLARLEAEDLDRLLRDGRKTDILIYRLISGTNMLSIELAEFKNPDIAGPRDFFGPTTHWQFRLGL